MKLSEENVKKVLGEYLKAKGGLYYSEFNLPTARKIDFISFRWEKDYEIEICGYECKGTISAKTAARTLREQVADYQKAVPKMYLVANSREEEKENIKTLCSLNDVGFLLVTDQKEISKERIEAPKERHLILDDDYHTTLRTSAAMFLSFRECFNDMLREPPREGKGERIQSPMHITLYWCSTPTKTNSEVQYNCGYIKESGTVYSSVNLENSRRVLKEIDLKQLTQELTSLSDEYWIKSGITNYPVPRMGLYTSLIKINASSVKIDDLTYLKERSHNEVVWFQAGKDLWSCDEMLPRRVHVSRVRQAREELSSVHQIMSMKKS